MHPTDTQTRDRKKKTSFRRAVPWGRLLGAAAVLALTVYYLTQTAPTLVPLPEGVNVPFPAATEALEKACAWCGENFKAVAGVAGFLLLFGLFCDKSYYTTLIVIACLGLGFTYISISAPIDRLLHSVDGTLNQEREFPDYMKEDGDKSRSFELSEPADS